MRVKRVCEICGKEFFATNAMSKYCSADCKRAGYKNRQKRFKEKHPDYMDNWIKENRRKDNGRN